jgi:hypothetical protein
LWRNDAKKRHERVIEPKGNGRMPVLKSLQVIGGLLGLAGVLAAASAMAEVQWYVDATFADGGTVKGTFSLGPTDYYAQDVNLQTSANGNFSGFLFGAPTDVAVGLPNHSTIIVFGPTYSGDQLVLYAENTLDVAGPNGLLSTSYECFDSYSCPTSPPGDTRYVVGPGILSVTAPAPEPGAWALMLIGVGAAGFAARVRRRGVTVAAKAQA